MKRLFSKPVFVFAVIAVLTLLFGFLALAVKMVLTAEKSKIENELSLYLHQNVFIGSIHYIPPSFIVLRDIRVSGNTADMQYLPLSIERITLILSLRELIGRKNLVISKIYFAHPELDSFNYPMFLKENLEGIINVINILAKGQPLKIVLENGRGIIDRKGSRAQAVIVDAKIGIGAGRRVSSSGRVMIGRVDGARKGRLAPSQTTGMPVEYDFAGTAREGGLAIETFRVSRGDFTAALQGELVKDELWLKGFATAEKFFPALIIGSGYRNEFMVMLENLLRYGKIPQRIGISSGSLAVFDIDCRLKIASKKITIDYIRANANNIPLRAKGAVFFGERTVIDCSIATFPDQPPEARRKNPRGMDAAFIGDAGKGKLNGAFDVVFNKNTVARSIPQHLEAAFQSLSFGLSPDGRFKLFIDELRLAYTPGPETYSFSLHNVDTEFDGRDKSLKLFSFSSGIFDGALTGRLGVNVSQWPLKTDCDLIVQDVSAHELDAVLLSLFGAYRCLPAKLPGRIDGRFACDLTYASYPVPVLGGNITIRDGILDNVRFFVWLSDFFNLPSLKKIDFTTVSADFVATETSAELRNIIVRASELSLDGMFDLKGREQISGKLSLSLPRELMATSPKFQLLLGLLDPKVTAVGFSFQLSGLYTSLNFKWLESDFKQRIQKLLPGFMERGIERKVQAAIQAIAKQ